MTELLIYFALTVGVSFFCSILEAVILSVPHGFVSHTAREGKKSGLILQRLKQDINRPLSAILTLNTIANTAGATLVGAQAEAAFAGHASIDRLVHFVVPAVLTFSVLTFAEIIPKTLGSAYCKQLAPVSAYAIRGLIILVYPIVLIFEQVTALFKSGEGGVTVSRDEILAFARMGVKEGALGDREARIIENLIRLKEIRAEDVMTPRAVISSFHKDMTIADVVKKGAPLPFSRLPIYGKDQDDILGIVLRHKITHAYASEERETKMIELLKPIHVVPTSLSVAGVLDEFIKRREHIFLVVDEHGGTGGIVTLEDAIETLLGVEIVDEFDTVADLRKFAREKFSNRQKKRSPTP